MKKTALFIWGCAFCALPVLAQSTGSISGVVMDQQNAVLPDASVTLTNQARNEVVRQMTTNSEGAFVATPLLPGTYTLVVEAQGFKTFTQSNIILNLNDRLGLPPIVMELGAVGESITVEAEAIQLETVSAERSGVVTGRQVVDIAVNGRNYTTLLKTVPGATVDGAFGGNSNFNGQRGFQNNFTVDGQNVTDTGVNQQFAYRINLDAVEEFKVTTNSQAAEFGRNSGAQIQLATKSGTNQFHGRAWWFKRGEFMNANDFISNMQGRQKQIYRFMQAGWNLGGPVVIPGTPVNGKDKLFFFASNEWGRSKTPPPVRRLTLPTAAERMGDFSATRDQAGKPVTIIDPLTGNPFPGNIIPSSRFNQYGPSVLNWLPMPNVFGNPQYNYESSVPSSGPTYDQVYRVDWAMNDKWRFYGRHLNSKQTQNNPYGRADSGNNLGLTPFYAPTYGWSLAGNAVTIINPTLINGIPGDAPPTGSPYYRQVSNINIPLLFPNVDPVGLVPNFTFGGGIGGDNGNRMTNFSGLPYNNRNPVYNITDNLTKIKGDHTMKFGIYYEYAVKSENPFRALNSNIDFTRDSNNPGDTNWAFANALLGNFNSYSQVNTSLLPEYPYTQVEWFAQDSWKVTRKLTVNYGLRMAYLQPLFDKKNQMANFDFSKYDPSQAVNFYQPAAGGKSLNPFTGEIGPGYLVGAIIPGSGDINNGMVVSGQNGTPRGLIKNRGVHWAPRLGIAYQIDKNTVFRMGGGAFYERIATFTVGYTSNFVTNPPTTRESQIRYGNLSTIQTSAGVAQPTTISRISDDGHVPTVYNYSAGIQRSLPASMVLDISYVGSQSRHLTLAEPFNYAPLGSAWLPQNQNPAAGAPKFDGTTTLPTNLYRPYAGYTAGSQYTLGTSTNYNALQTALNKRAGRLILGVAYTWSRALGVDQGHITNNRVANYGPLSLDRTHVLTFNYVYDFPGLSNHVKAFDNAGGRLLFDGWQLSGLTSFSSGAPINITYSVTGIAPQTLNRKITGSEDVAPRPVFTCAPKLSHADKSIYQFFDTSCFAPAPVGSQGMDSGWNQVRGPGTNQWDMSVFKKINFNESTYIQLRLEAYNVFNHTQWGSISTAAQFDQNGNITNLPTNGGGRFGFGALSNIRANSARILQIAAKFYF